MSSKNNNIIEKNPILFDKHSNISSSPIVICYLILNKYVKNPKQIKEDKRISIYTIFNDIKKINSKIPSEQIYLSLVLMHALNLASFDRPYLIIKKNDHNKKTLV